MSLFETPAQPPLVAGPVGLMRLVEVDSIDEVLDQARRMRLAPEHLAAETKFNGWLIQAAGGRLWSRRGKELTAKFPEIARAVRPYSNAHLMGELVYWTPEGVMDEPTVTRVAGTKNPDEAIAKLRALPGSFEFILFDAIAVGGYDVSAHPTFERRYILECTVKPCGGMSLSKVYPFENWQDVYEAGVQAGGDGVVLKNMNAPYVWRPLGQSEARPSGT